MLAVERALGFLLPAQTVTVRHMSKQPTCARTVAAWLPFTYRCGRRQSLAAPQRAGHIDGSRRAKTSMLTNRSTGARTTQYVFVAARP